MEFASALCGNTAETWREFLLLAVPPATIVAAFLVVMWAGARIARVPMRKLYWAFLAAFCMIGIVPGVVAGYSQQAIAGTFLTATVGIVSALLSYAFAKDSLQLWRPLIPVLIVATLFGALAGFGAGGVARDRWLIYDQTVEQSRVEREKVWAPTEALRRQENLKRLAARQEGYISVADLIQANTGPPPTDSNGDDDDAKAGPKFRCSTTPGE
jgi:hypothetical protein